MPRRNAPTNSPPPDRQFWIIAVLAISLLLIVVGFLIWSLNQPAPQVAQQPPQPTYVPPPAITPPSVEPAPPAVPSTLPAATAPALPPVSPPPVIEPLPVPATPPPAPPATPQPPATAPAAPRPPPVAVTPVPPVPQRPAKPAQSVQMQLGNPSQANNGSGNVNNYLMLKPYFALSYNDSRGEPNWVSWRVTPEDIAGQANRKATFDTDNTLPPGVRPITTKDYALSGFDRGHMCPHSDRDANLETSYATFIMTNIVPQSPHNNQRGWAQLEDYGRSLVKDGVHTLVISGPLGRGGEGSKGKADTIAGGRVVVPAWTWKILVIVPPGPGTDVSRVTSACRVIAVLVPNDQSVGEPWAPYICTVADIEQKTGYTFFDTLPADVAAALRVKKDVGP